MALAAGRLGTVPLAAQSVIMTTDQVLNTIPFGIGVAASTRFAPPPNSLPLPICFLGNKKETRRRENKKTRRQEDETER